MMIMVEIQAKYLEFHNALGSRKDAVDKELFDQQHAAIWADCKVELKARKEELKVKVSLTDEETKELTELTRMFPEPPADSPDEVIVKNYLADPHCGVPPLEEAFQALARLHLGVK